MALDRIWQQDGLEYINLAEDPVFRPLMMEKSDELIDYGKGAKRILRPFTGTFRPVNVNYKGLSANVTIQNFPQTGRGIVASQAIDISEKVAISEAFVTVLNSTELEYCVACGGEVNSTANRCRSCETTLCSKCKHKNNTSHTYECGTTFHNLHFVHLHMKSAIQMLFKALAIYKVKTEDDLHNLKTDVATILTNNNNNGIPGRVVTDKERFECIMRLHTIEDEDFGGKWFEVYSIIMQYAEIRAIFRTEENQRFLGHLLGHFLAVTYANSFETQVAGVMISNLFHIPSFFNHSCSPNVLHYVKGNKMHCITTRNIAQGEQLYISYSFFDSGISTFKRRRRLQTSWNFDCECLRCTHADITNNDINDALARLRNYNFLMDELERLGNQFIANGMVWIPELGEATIVYQRRVRLAMKQKPKRN